MSTNRFWIFIAAGAIVVAMALAIVLLITPTRNNSAVPLADNPSSYNIKVYRSPT